MIISPDVSGASILFSLMWVRFRSTNATDMMASCLNLADDCVLAV
jgi:hypothetical protein